MDILIYLETYKFEQGVLCFFKLGFKNENLVTLDKIMVFPVVFLKNLF